MIKLLFRADGNNKVGLGHVYRCIAIADRLKEYFEIYFGISNPSDEIVKNIEKVAKVLILPFFIDKLEEADYLNTKIIPQLDIKGITLDGYFFNTEFQKKLKENKKIKIISIDDYQQFHYLSDYVINHADGLTNDQFSVADNTKLLLGSKYSLLRKEFLDFKLKQKFIIKANTIFICFGGADKENHTLQMLTHLNNIDFISEINIVIGASYLNKFLLEEMALSNGKIKIYENLDTDELSNLMFKCHVGILPSSTICLEAIESKMIVITGITAENQQSIYKGLITKKNIFGIGYFNEISNNMLKDTLINIYKNYKNVIIESDQEFEDCILIEFKKLFYD